MLLEAFAPEQLEEVSETLANWMPKPGEFFDLVGFDWGEAEKPEGRFCSKCGQERPIRVVCTHTTYIPSQSAVVKLFPDLCP